MLIVLIFRFTKQQKHFSKRCYVILEDIIKSKTEDYGRQLHKEAITHVCNICCDGFSSLEQLDEHKNLHGIPNNPYGFIKEEPCDLDDLDQSCENLGDFLEVDIKTEVKTETFEPEIADNSSNLVASAPVFPWLAPILPECPPFFLYGDKMFVRVDNVQSSCEQTTNTELIQPENIKNEIGETIQTSKDDAKTPEMGVKDETSSKIQCEECGEEFLNEKTLRTHQKNKHIPCKHCGKKLYSKSNLKDHMNIHLGLKPYKCKFCDVGFANCGALKVHCRTHTGEKPYKCTHCDQSFSQRHILTVHVRRRHTGEKPFSCSVCDTAFVSINLLNSHMKSKHVD